MPDILFVVLVLLLGSYALFTLALTFLWYKVPAPGMPSPPLTATVSVIIPVRNEAHNIQALLADLDQQSYDKSLFEVLVVDDGSTDHTVRILKHVQNTLSYSLTIIELPSSTKVQSPKKQALEKAIHIASGTYILTTDGDCRVGADWIKSFAASFESTKAKLLSGPVTFINEKGPADYLQTVEFSSLIGSGASAIAAGQPSLCNGANLAYEKQVFIDVGGFAGNEHLASGDDEFLMHKVAERYPGQIYFIKDRRAIVRTTPHSRWIDFYRQRKRWASKWKHYKNPANTALAVYIFMSNAALIIALLGGFTGAIAWEDVGLLLLIKWVPEWFFIGSVLSFLKKSRSIPYILIVQLLYPFYVTLFGLVVQQPTYEWKGRKLS
jgi:cellulose synthase/poly-beta-1,6-N-acetylglucosamine synthase-like glycosyltransferase